MQLRLLRKLIYRLVEEGDISICDTCEYNCETGCKYNNSNECSDRLEFYKPNEKVINEL